MSNSKRREAEYAKALNKTRSRAEADAVSNKIIAFFAVALLGTFGIMLLRNRVAAQGPATMTGLKILAVFGALLCIASILYYFKTKKQGQANAYWFAFLSLAGFLACVCSLLMLIVGYKICAFLAFILPVIALYYFLSTVFHGDNYISLVLCGLGVLLFWFSYRYSDIMGTACRILYAVYFLILILITITVTFVKSGIYIRGKDKTYTLLARGEKHTVLLFTIGFLAVATLLSYFLGVPAAYVLMFVTIAYTLVCAVVFTARL